MRMYSRVLEEEIECVEDGKEAPPADSLVSYTRSEIKAMNGLDRDALRAVHRAKKHFGGRYQGPSPRRP